MISGLIFVVFLLHEKLATYRRKCSTQWRERHVSGHWYSPSLQGTKDISNSVFHIVFFSVILSEHKHVKTTLWRWKHTLCTEQVSLYISDDKDTCRKGDITTDWTTKHPLRSKCGVIPSMDFSTFSYVGVLNTVCQPSPSWLVKPYFLVPVKSENMNNWQNWTKAGSLWWSGTIFNTSSIYLVLSC